MNLYKKFLKGKSFFQTPYCFFGLDVSKNTNPEKLSKEGIDKIKKCLAKKPNDLFCLESFIIYYDNMGKLDLDSYFKQYFEIKPNNPYMLLRYARYYSSPLYKLNNRSNKYLLFALKQNIKAVNILESIHNKKEIPTFAYSWLGYIYLELGENHKAIKYFNKTINFNKDYHNFKQSEPFLWKAIALNKIGKYKESNEVYFKNINEVEKGVINDKLDFRVYKIISDNYFNLKEYDYFYKYLIITIKKFLEIGNFHFDNIIELSLSNNKLSYIPKTWSIKYKLFLDNNSFFIRNDIDNIIFSIAFLYEKKLSGEIITFNDSRGIEELCYNYYKLGKSNKIK